MLEDLSLKIMFFIVIILGAAASYVVMTIVKSLKKQTHEYDRKLNILAGELTQLRNSLVDPVNRLYEAEQRSRRFTERLEQLELREKSSRQYGQAAKLIHNGSSVEEIMEVCGLNRGEAELIKVMNELEAGEKMGKQMM